MEIEKKYLVNTDLYLDWFYYADKILNIEQHYLNDTDENWLIRVRSYGPTYYLTLKSKGLLSREELEFQITKSEFEKAILHSRKSLKKKRYIAVLPDYPGLVFEIDSYDHYRFMTCEIEFETEEQAMEFKPPRFCDRDVTEDPLYKNVNLAVWKP